MKLFLTKNMFPNSSFSNRCNPNLLWSRLQTHLETCNYFGLISKFRICHYFWQLKSSWRLGSAKQIGFASHASKSLNFIFGSLDTTSSGEWSTVCCSAWGIPYSASLLFASLPRYLMECHFHTLRKNTQKRSFRKSCNPDVDFHWTIWTFSGGQYIYTTSDGSLIATKMYL